MMRINGALVHQNGYEYGVKFKEDPETTWFDTYEEAKTSAKFWNEPLKMRCHYVSEEMDAK